MLKNPIIVFEGIEGSGKSFHIDNVVKHLRKRKKKFIQIREPGGSKNSEKIRKLILDNKSTFNKYTDLLLYLSSRSENIEIIKKNIGKKIILIDRFTDSTLAYQHYGMGVDIKIIKFINNFLLKVSAKEILSNYKSSIHHNSLAVLVTAHLGTCIFLTIYLILGQILTHQRKIVLI